MVIRSKTSKTNVDLNSREQLIDATLQLIVAHGVDAVKIDDVISMVGVTKGSLYWHFEDRQALIKAALIEQIRRVSNEMVEVVSTAIENAPDKESYVQQVGAVLTDPYDADSVEKRWQRIELLCSARRDSEMSALMQEVQRKNHQILVELMVAAQKNGRLRGELDPNAVALAINAIDHGSNLISVLGDAAPTQQDWLNLMVFFLGVLFPPEHD